MNGTPTAMGWWDRGWTAAGVRPVSALSMRIMGSEPADEQAGGHLATTLADVRDSLSASPQCPYSHLRLGITLGLLGRHSEAVTTLRKGVRFAPNQLRARYEGNLGIAYQATGAGRLAERSYRKAIELVPQDTLWHIFLGSLFSLSGKLIEAKRVFERATRCRAGDRDEAYQNLGRVLRAQRRYPQAQCCFRAGLDVSPGDEGLRNDLADADEVVRLSRTDWKHWMVPTTSRARIDLDGDAGMEPDEFSMRLREARDYGERNMPACHLEGASCLVTARPTSAVALLEYGDALRVVGRTAEAIQTLRRGMTKCPPEYVQRFHGRLAMAYQAGGRRKLAERFFRRAIDGLTGNTLWHIMLGQMLFANGRMPEAEVVLRRALACRRGDRHEAALSLGDVLRAQERYVEARSCYRRALKLLPNCSQAPIAIADLDGVIRRRGIRKT